MNRLPLSLLAVGAAAVTAAPALAQCSTCGSAPQPTQSYSQPSVSYAQPAQSYSQPTQSFSRQSTVSYGQSSTCGTTSYAQPSQSMSYSQPTQSYSQPTVSYSQPTVSYGQSSTCGTTSYSQPVQQMSYGQPSYQSSGCGTTSVASSGCDPCGQQATQTVNYGSTQSFQSQSFQSQPFQSQPTQSYATTCGTPGTSFAQPSYSSGIVQTSGVTSSSDCGCSTPTQTQVSYADPCGQSASVSYGQPSYGQPMQSYGQPSYGQPMTTGSTGCSTCSQGVVIDGTSNMGAPTADPNMQGQSTQGTPNYGQSLQQGGVIQGQPLDTTTQQPNRNAGQNGQQNADEMDGDTGATAAPEVPDTLGDEFGDEA